MGKHVGIFSLAQRASTVLQHLPLLLGQAGYTAMAHLALDSLLPLMLILCGVGGVGRHTLVQRLVGADALAWLFRASMRKLALTPAPAPESA